MNQLEQHLQASIEAAHRRNERQQLIQYLHWRAFVAQWKADNKPENHAAMKAAFTAQQQQMAARKITVSIRFANGSSTPIREIIRDESDPMLMAIYVTGLREVTTQ